MFKMSEASAIALHSMVYLTNRPDSCVRINEIAEKFSISSNHLSKILQRLLKAGFLESVKGPKGGFKVMSKKKDATLLAVYETIEGKIKIVDCIFQSSRITCSNCIMDKFSSRVNSEFKEYLTTHKISDFIL